MKDITFKMIVCAVFFAQPANSEIVGTQFNNLDLPQDTTLSGSPDQGGLVNTAGGASSVGGMLVDSNQIQDNSAQNAVEGRRNKTEDSISKGNQGVAAAIAAGTALTAAGIAALPPPTTPRGVALLAMAGLEFAQAGATGGVTSKNTGGRNTLRDGTPEGSQAAAALQEAVKQIDTPQIRQALADSGVNSDAFIDDLVSGRLSNFEDVQRALGVTETFTDEQVATAQAEAVGVFSGSVHGNPEGRQTVDVARLTTDDSAPAGKGSNKSGLGGQSASSASAGGIAGGVAGGLAAQGQPPKTLLQEAQAMAAKELQKAKAQGYGDVLDVNKLVAKYLAKLKEQKGKSPAGSKSRMTRYRLEKLGIKPLRKRQNIFQLSKRTYRSYNKWRKRRKRKERLAKLRASR